MVLIPETACQGLDRLVEARREEVELLKDEISILEEETRNLSSKSTR